MELIERIKNGDENAFEQFIKEKERLLKSVAYGILQNREDVEDALQNCYLRFFKSKGRLNESKNPTAYLVQIVKNVCFDLLKSDRKGYKEDFESANLSYTENKAENIDRKKVIASAMKILNDKERLVISLVHTQGYTSYEVAELTGFKDSTVRTYYMNGREKMKNFIIKFFPEFAR